MNITQACELAFLVCHGPTGAGNWTTGHKRFTKAKALPPGCHKADRGYGSQAALAYFAANPKVRRVVYADPSAEIAEAAAMRIDLKIAELKGQIAAGKAPFWADTTLRVWRGYVAGLRRLVDEKRSAA